VPPQAGPRHLSASAFSAIKLGKATSDPFVDYPFVLRQPILLRILCGECIMNHFPGVAERPALEPLSDKFFVLWRELNRHAITLRDVP
jgi:hypothetical protein